MMGKYIIEIPDDMIVSRELPTLAIKARFGNMRQFALDTGLKLTPYDDDAERRGAEKAWELARRIDEMAVEELQDCFNRQYRADIHKMPYVDVNTKFEAWVKQDEEIKVGDEVRSKVNPSKIRIITNVTKMGDRTYFSGMKPDGIADWFLSTEYIEKTGRHFPAVVELLKEIGENNNE